VQDQQVSVEAAEESQNGSGEAEDQALRPEPVLRVPEDLTPLPAVDLALPTLSLFSGVLGRRRARYKVAVLKTLQADGSGRWKIRRLQEVLHWLEPASTTELAAELRAAGVLAYDPVSGIYRLTTEARVVTAILDALTVPGLDPRRLIRFLSKAMSLALAAGAGEDAVFGQFASAVAILRSDLDELRGLIDDFSETALLAAAELVRAHVDDMRDLLEEHASFFAEHRHRTLYLDQEQEALDLVARLGSLSADVIAALTGRADQLMRGGLRIDRSDLREFTSRSSVGELGSIVEGLASVPPFVPWLLTGAAFDALEEALGRRPAEPPPLPEPMPLAREAPPPEDGRVEELVRELLALSGPATVAEIVVAEAWAASVSRHGALIEAYSRDGTTLPVPEHDEHAVDEPRRGGVWRVSRTTLRPRNGSGP